MNRIVVLVGMLFMSVLVYAQRNEKMISYFFTVKDEPNIIIATTTHYGHKVPAGGYYKGENNIFIHPDTVDKEIVYLHEFVHYVIDKYKIDHLGYGEEYLCNLVTAIYELSHKKISKIYYAGVELTFYKSELKTYIEIFNKVFGGKK